MRIGLDIDDTICNFYHTYLDRFGVPKEDTEITKNVRNVLINDKDFWLNLPIINRPDFNPTLYCTKRVHPKVWTKKFLEINDIPIAPIYQVFCQSSSKAPRVKGRIDVFIDDSISNFIDMNLHGVPCLLIDGSHNQSWGPIGRIYSLNRDEIEDTYHLFKSTIYPHFKELVSK